MPVPASENDKPASERRTMPFFPNFLAMDLGMRLIALNVITILDTVFPWALGQLASPISSAPNGIHPEWYFMPPFYLLKLIGKVVPGITGEAMGMALFAAVLVFWTLVPLFDPRRLSAAVPSG